jgi:molybdopterin-guanine dinucleotide biosynthesis protein MobB
MDDNEPMIPLLTIIGRPEAVKSVLLERLIYELNGRGYHVAVVKPSSSSSSEINTPGEDSPRFTQTQSQQVMVASPGKSPTYRRLEKEMTL